LPDEEEQIMVQPEGDGALHGVRVLDLTDETAGLGTKLLADLGADVIKVEPPAGDPARRLGPFYQRDEDPEKSLFFWHYNTNKRSIALDLDRPAERETFRRLVQRTDILVDSLPVGRLATLGLDREGLRTLNPGLIHASVTPYGQTGPRAGWKGNDLTAWAMGGLMTLCGEPDREPLRGVLGQAVPLGCAEIRYPLSE
jgi:crotonobetainyl-CoA:carnitine CoA-transferase CaiB-like acyl-CoA transferase